MITVIYSYCGNVVAKDFATPEDWENYYDELNPTDNPYIIEVLEIKKD